MPPRKKDVSPKKATRSVKSSPKTKAKVEKTKRPRKPKLNPVVNQQTIKCMNWLEETKKVKTETPVPEEIPEEVQIEEDNYVPTKKRKIIHGLLKDENIFVNYSCDWAKCNTECSEPEEYKKHILSHVSDPKQHKIGDEFICLWDLCAFKTTDEDHFFRHVMYHEYHSRLLTKGDVYRRTQNLPPCLIDSRERNSIPVLSKDFFCSWDDCTDKFKIISDYIAHVRYHYTCVVQDRELDKVMAKKSKNSKNSPVKGRPLICKWTNCEKVFPEKHVYLKHSRFHTGEKVIGCDHCGKLNYDNFGYIGHCQRQKITNDINCQCTQCGKFFATESILAKHFKQHINCFKCQFCDMTVPSKGALVCHIRFKHLKERPFKCPHCDYRGVRKHDLQRHLPQHEKMADEEYECDEFGCGYVCGSAGTLRQHYMLKHSSLQPRVYGCHVCEKRITTGCSMTNHLKKVHGFQPGCSRFTYRMDEDYVYRVNTMRIESLEVSKEIMSNKTNVIPKLNSSDIKIDIGDLSKKGLNIKVDIPKKKTVKTEPKSVTRTGRKTRQQKTKESKIDIITELPQFEDIFPGKKETVVSEPAKLKSIDNFMVMRKYITDPTKKNIEITLADVDKDGNIIENKKIDVEEIVMEIE